MKKTITVVTPCYNEEKNIDIIYQRVKQVFAELTAYDYKHLFIDNSSTDQTVAKIKALIKEDNNVQLIVNSRNFGIIRSPYYGLLQPTTEATVLIAADLQEPPELINDFIKKWEAGYKIAVGVKNKSNESKLMFFIRTSYYKLVKRIADVQLINNFTGFGLYDQTIIENLRKIQDPYPYFRGLIPELGFDVAEITFTQEIRKRGISKCNFYTLYDYAMLGITSNSKVPLRLATMGGFALAMLSFLLSLVYLILKLIFWNSFSVGVAPILIGLFFFSSMQLFFIGIVGEYVAQVLTQVLNRPLVIEKERINI